MPLRRLLLPFYIFLFSWNPSQQKGTSHVAVTGEIPHSLNRTRAVWLIATVLFLPSLLGLYAFQKFSFDGRGHALWLQGTDRFQESGNYCQPIFTRLGTIRGEQAKFAKDIWVASPLKHVLKFHSRFFMHRTICFSAGAWSTSRICTLWNFNRPRRCFWHCGWSRLSFAPYIAIAGLLDLDSPKFLISKIATTIWQPPIAKLIHNCTRSRRETGWLKILSRNAGPHYFRCCLYSIYKRLLSNRK